MSASAICHKLRSARYDKPVFMTNVPAFERIPLSCDRLNSRSWRLRGETEGEYILA